MNDLNDLNLLVDYLSWRYGDESLAAELKSVAQFLIEQNLPKPHTQRSLWLAAVMPRLGFIRKTDYVYWTGFFGETVEFDFSRGPNQMSSVMSEIFNVCLKIGAAEKLEEIRRVLGIIQK